MRVRFQKVSIAVGFASLLALVAAPAAQAQEAGRGRGPQPLPVLKNVQLLKGFTAQQVVDEMRGWARQLGVQCNHCHVAGATGLDFANDDKREKRVAKRMYEMVTLLNKDFFVHAKSAECYICHKGQAVPSEEPGHLTFIAPDDVLVGTWKLNSAKSTYADPKRKSQSQTVRLDSMNNNSIKFVSDSVSADGKADHTEYVAKLGEDSKVSQGEINGVLWTRKEKYIYENLQKKDGQLLTTVTVTISPDGKTMTVDDKGAITQKVVFEKQ